MNETENVILHHFLEPMDRKPVRHFGAEFEFPVINLAGGSVDPEVTRGLLRFLIDTLCCEQRKQDAWGCTIAIENPNNGDLIAYEYCFHMLEISLARSLDLVEVANRLHFYLKHIQDYLGARNHILSGFGVHPHAGIIDESPIDLAHYRMLNHFMRLRPPTGPFYDINFFAIVNSVQIHLDCPLADIPRLFDIFSRLDWINATLFSNSFVLDADEKPAANYLGCRDLYYLANMLGEMANNVGPFDGPFRDIDDVCRAVSNCAIWYLIEDGNYIFFRPIRLAEFFQTSRIDCFLMDDAFRVHAHSLVPNESHVAWFKCFKHAAVTKHKTIEIRSACQQPLSEVLAPVAFTIGCNEVLDELQVMLQTDGFKLSNREQRQAVAVNRIGKIGPRDRITGIVKDVVAAAHRGLLRRGKGEERFLEPAIERAERLCCPAADALRELRSATSLDHLIRRNAEWRWHDFSPAVVGGLTNESESFTVLSA